MRSVRALLVTLLVPVVTGVAGSVALAVHGPAAPAAATTAPCVGVVVDARLAGGALRAGCAKGDPRTGLAALTAAGFSYAFEPRQPGLVCQIDGLPACSRTTSSTYWSYWYRAKGSTRWVYAAQGAGSHDPAPGSTEGWVWQEGGRRQPPSIAQDTLCPPVAQPTRSPRPATSSPAPRPASAEPRSPAGTTSRAHSTHQATRPASTAPAPARGTATPGPTAATTSAAPAPSTSTPPVGTGAAGGRTPPAADGDGRGTPWVAPAVGLGAVVLLGGAAVARSRRGDPR